MGTYYVDDATGNDSRSAAEAMSVSTPWKTIQKALSTVPGSGDGDTIYVKAGNYPEPTNTYLLIDAAQNGKTLAVEGYATIPGDNGIGVRLTTTATLFSVYVTTASTSGDITFRNIKLTSDSVSSTKPQVDYRGAAALRFRRCEFGGASAGSAIVSISTLSGTIDVDGTCTFAATASHAVSVTSGTLAAVAVQNSSLSGSSTSGRHSISITGTVAALTVAGNAIAVANASAAGVYIPSGTHSIGSATFERNEFSVSGAGSSGLLLPGQLDAWSIKDNQFAVSADAPGTGCQIGTDGGVAAEAIGAGVLSGNIVVFSGADGSHGFLVGSGIAASQVTDNSVQFALSGAPTSSSIGLVIKSAGHTVTGNIVCGPRPLLLKGAAQDNDILHNTFVCTAGDCVAWYAAPEGNPTGNTIKDNIIVVAGGSLLVSDYDGATNGSDWNNLLDYNVYDTDGVNFGRLGANTYATFALFSAAWETYSPAMHALGADSHSVNSDPLLADPENGNVSIPSGSPARDAASDDMNIGAWQNTNSAQLLGCTLL